MIVDRDLERRPLGATGLQVSALGMGCGRIGSVPRPRDLRSALDAISLALASGINFLDTADSYGRGLSEALLGRAVSGRREDVLIATKCGMLKTPPAFLRAATTRPTPGPNARAPRMRDASAQLLRSRRCYEPRYVRRSAGASLRRLRRDHIDLFLLHSPPTEVLVRADFVEAFDELKAAGRIRFWGVSVRSSDDALLAMKLPGIAAIEIELNICEHDALRDVLPQARSRGVGVIARQPFASGGVLRAWRERGGNRPETSADSLTRADALTQKDVLDASLHFVLRAEGVATVIAGMTKPEHVAANVASALSERVGPDEIATVQTVLCGPR